MSMTKKMNVNDRIRKAMRDNERKVLARVREENRRGNVYREWTISTWGWHNALKRLEAKGLIRYTHARKWEASVVGGYVAANLK